MKSPLWPKYFKDRMIVGNPEHHVALCCLWTVRLLIASFFEKDWDPKKTPTFSQSEKANTDNIFKSKDYAAIGSLVSKQGISFIIRNLLLNTNIRYLVLCGYDRSHTGKYLHSLWQDGIDNDNCLMGYNEVQIDKDIPKSSVDRVIQNIKLINICGKWDKESIVKAVKSCKKLPDYGDTEEFPLSEAKVNTYPAEYSGIRIEGKTTAETWLRILKEIMDYGIPKTSKYGAIKERLNLVSVITEEDPDKPYFAPWLRFSKQELKEYLPEVLTAALPEGLHYTYGYRYRAYFGHDQIKAMIEAVKTNKDTRRAFASAYDSRSDHTATNAPCITDMVTNVIDDKIFLTVHIRSNDMFDAWPRNALALRAIQKEIAQATGYNMGHLTIISTSAHIYEMAFSEIEEILNQYYKNEPECRFDPRGNFVLFVKDKKIIAKHVSPDGVELRQFEASSAMAMYRKILSERAISDLQHAMDLGTELSKAEVALNSGLVYTQDQPILLVGKEGVEPS